MARSRAQSLLLALLLSVAPVVAPAAATGQSESPLVGLDGDRLGDAELGQGTLIVVVWASWSPRCRDIGARVNGISERWGGQAQVVTVNFQESASAARAFRREQGLKAPVYLDPTATFAKRYAVTSLPFLLVFKDGANVVTGKLLADPDGMIGRAVKGETAPGR